MGRYALAAAALLALSAAPAAAAATAPKVIKLVSIGTSDKAVDAKPKGPSAGDTDVATSRLVNAAAQFGKPRGAVVGNDYSKQVLTSAKSGRVTGWAKLPGGKLTINGPIKVFGDGRISIPVTAGTGAFAGAAGRVEVYSLGLADHPDWFANVYYLTYHATA
jgi:hypothetical protein